MKGSSTLKISVWVLLLGLAVSGTYGDNPKHREEILKNIQEIYVGGDAGLLTIYGGATTSILGGEYRDSTPNVYHGIVAANTIGNGRVVGCSHTGFLNPHPNATPEQPGHLGTNQFILNTARWASQMKSPKVIIVRSNGGDVTLEHYLNTSGGMSAMSIKPEQLVSINDLKGFDVALVTDHLNGDAHAAILLEFVWKYGKGLVIALKGHDYTMPYVNASQHMGLVFPPNQISSKAGFVWRNGKGKKFAGVTTPTGNFKVSSDFIKHINTRQVWSDVYKSLNGGEGSEDIKQNPNQFISIIEMDLQSIPPNDNFFRGDYFHQMRKFVLDLDRQPIPTPENPITSQHDKLLIRMFHLLVDLVLKPEEIPSHPASKYFPGTTALSNYPGPAGPSVRTIEVSMRHSHWISTGFYAESGKVISVSVLTNTSIPLGVRIGCHTDDISRYDKWIRLPLLTKEIPLIKNGLTKIASPYGGLIYITRPGDVSVNEKDLTVTVSIQGGYTFPPFFKLGHTSLKEWQKIKFYGGPWAEFESEKIVLTAPRDSAQKISNPENVLLFWDSVMDAIADLLSIPRERTRQQRIVPDIEISGGWMHSGYPIMTYLSAGDMAIKVTEMRKELNGWGHFHELGHNHQKSAWTFKGTGEVTNNLFALYIFNTVLDLPAAKAHEMVSPEVYKPRVAEYIQTGTEFTNWQSKAGLAFVFYYQLQQAYGWDAYKQVFARYNELGRRDQPGTDEEKIDLWLVMFSKVVGQNLGPLFKSWGIPFTPKAQAQIQHFPETKIRITDMI